MILKKLTLHKFGPFSKPAVLDLETDVTVITGPNDTGKSSLLRLIDLIFTNSSIAEADINVDSIFEMDSSWEKYTGVQVTAVFTGLSDSQLKIEGLSSGDDVEIQILLAPAFDKNLKTIKVYANGETKLEASPVVVAYPRIIKLPDNNSIRTAFLLQQLNDLEARVISIAFGDNAYHKFSKMNEALLQTEISRGNRRLNEAVSTWFPRSMSFELKLLKLSNNPLQFSLNIVDSQESDTPLSYRGSGAQKIINLVASFLNLPKEAHVCILFDEPETSLHADAQHFLRSVLENLAENPFIQVIYTTHSPSMVNSLRPESLRLVTRTKIDNKPTSQIDNRPIKENYLPVRSSLGLTPSDSLLYAPIAFIVEGVTEIFCIPFLLKKFAQESIEGFDKILSLLSQCHFIDGQGDSFEYWCRLAKSQGSKPIIFVDGDKIRRVRQEKLDEKHPDVPVITLDEGTEFEEIVHRTIYFQALKTITNEDISVIKFDKWEQSSKLPKQMMLSKKIERWLQDNYPEAVYRKAEVMREAIKIAKSEEINKNPLLEIVEAIAGLIGDDHFHQTKGGQPAKVGDQHVAWGEGVAP